MHYTVFHTLANSVMIALTITHSCIDLWVDQHYRRAWKSSWQCSWLISSFEITHDQLKSLLTINSNESGQSWAIVSEHDHDRVCWGSLQLFACPLFEPLMESAVFYAFKSPTLLAKLCVQMGQTMRFRGDLEWVPESPPMSLSGSSPMSSMVGGGLRRRSGIDGIECARWLYRDWLPSSSSNSSSVSLPSVSTSSSSYKSGMVFPFIHNWPGHIHSQPVSFTLAPLWRTTNHVTRHVDAQNKLPRYNNSRISPK